MRGGEAGALLCSALCSHALNPSALSSTASPQARPTSAPLVTQQRSFPVLLHAAAALALTAPDSPLRPPRMQAQGAALSERGAAALAELRGAAGSAAGELLEAVLEGVRGEVEGAQVTRGCLVHVDEVEDNA